MKVVLLGLMLASPLLVIHMTDLSEETDATNIIEGNVTPTIRFWITEEYTLYYEGTGDIPGDYSQWEQYIHLIYKINISDGITSFDTDSLSGYINLEEIEAGRDLEYLYIWDPIALLVFPNGCGEMKELNVVFTGYIALVMDEIALRSISDRYTSIYMMLVPNSAIPEEAREFVGYNKVYELYVYGADTFEGRVFANVLYGDVSMPMTTYHLVPTYAVESSVNYYYVFEMPQTGYYAILIDVPPIIPNAPLIATGLIVLFSILAIFYYVRYVRDAE